MEISKSNNSPRANVTAKKYRKQIDWRRNKVRELLIRGYSQYEISNTLHISQPTVSRDINHIYEQKRKRQRKYGNELFLELQNTLGGLAELIKKSWEIVDDPKTEQKERMKAISLILQCYNRRFELLKFEPEVNQIKEYIDTAKRAAKEIESREKALQAYLDGRKLKMDEVYKATDPNRVF